MKIFNDVRLERLPLGEGEDAPVALFFSCPSPEALAAFGVAIQEPVPVAPVAGAKGLFASFSFAGEEVLFHAEDILCVQGWGGPFALRAAKEGKKLIALVFGALSPEQRRELASAAWERGTTLSIFEGWDEGNNSPVPFEGHRECGCSEGVDTCPSCG